MGLLLSTSFCLSLTVPVSQVGLQCSSLGKAVKFVEEAGNENKGLSFISFQ